MSMQSTASDLLAVGRMLADGQVPDPSVDPVLSRGLRANRFVEHTGAARAVDMLLARIEGRPYETEYDMPRFDRVAPAPPLVNPESATVALVTSGGIVPRGNPDRIEAANASRYGTYPVAGLEALTADSHQSVHGGYDPTFANADPNRVLPLDALRELEAAGRIGRLHPRYYATVGNATSVDRARRYGAEIAAALVNEGVQAVVFTST